MRPIVYLTMLVLLALVSVPVACACYYISSMLPALNAARAAVGG